MKIATGTCNSVSFDGSPRKAAFHPKFLGFEHDPFTNSRLALWEVFVVFDNLGDVFSYTVADDGSEDFGCAIDLNEFIATLESDADAGRCSLSEFVAEYDYHERDSAIRAWDSCKMTLAKLQSMFSAGSLHDLFTAHGENAC